LFHQQGTLLKLLALRNQQSSKPEALPPLPVEQPHSKHPLPPGFFFTTNHLTVMILEGDKHRRMEHDSKEHNYDDVAMGIDVSRSSWYQVVRIGKDLPA
jgi:hypothetical protein